MANGRKVTLLLWLILTGKPNNVRAGGKDKLDHNIVPTEITTALADHSILLQPEQILSTSGDQYTIIKVYLSPTLLET